MKSYKERTLQEYHLDTAKYEKRQKSYNLIWTLFLILLAVCTLAGLFVDSLPLSLLEHLTLISFAVFMAVSQYRLLGCLPIDIEENNHYYVTKQRLHSSGWKVWSVITVLSLIRLVLWAILPFTSPFRSF